MSPTILPHFRLPGSALLLRRALAPLLFALLAAATVTAASDTDPFQARPYGRAWTPGERAAPTLEHAGSSVILAGGAPGELAVVLVGASRARRPLSGGGELLVASALTRFLGRFDANERFVVDLEGEVSCAGGVLFLQGMSRGAGRGGESSLSRGLRLERVTRDAPSEAESPEASFNPWQGYFPPIHVSSVLEALGQSDFGEALARMLNSSGDELEVELEGEVTGGSGANLGGSVKLALKLECAEAGVYDLLLGRDASFVAGVELVEGLEAKAKLGVGMDDVWRFHSQDELEYGIVAFAVMQAMGPRAEIAAEGAYRAGQLAQLALDEARELVALRSRALAMIEHARCAQEQAWSRAPYWLRNARYAALASLRSWAAELRNLVQSADRARAFAEDAAEIARAACQGAFEALTWVHDSRLFLSERVHGIELRFAKNVELELSCGPIPGVDLENLGAGLEVGLDRIVHLRWTGPFHADGEKLAVSFTSERKADVDAGFLVGMELDGKREIEIQKEFVRVGGRFESRPATARIAFDLAVCGEVGVGLTAEGGAGRTLTICFDADELKRIGPDGIEALRAGNPSQAARILARTSARFEVDDRLFVGLALDLGVSYLGNGFSFESKLRWSDHGTQIEEDLALGEGLARVVGLDLLTATRSVTRVAASETIQVVAAEVSTR